MSAAGAALSPGRRSATVSYVRGMVSRCEVLPDGCFTKGSVMTSSSRPSHQVAACRITDHRRVLKRLFLVVLAAPIAWLGVAPVAFADVPDAMRAIAAGDCKAAGEEINQGLQRNDSQAFFLAGYLYDQTGCVASDPAHAARLYRRAISLGNADAAIQLGLLYAMGRGVPQDYGLAHRAFSGQTVQDGDAGGSAPDAVEAGYVETIINLARNHVDYPATANVIGIEAAMDVVVELPAGQVSFEQIHVGTEIGSSLSRNHDFTDQIAKAYHDAMAVLPKPPIGVDGPHRYVTHWTFAMRRGSEDQKLRREGFLTVGETRRVG